MGCARRDVSHAAQVCDQVESWSDFPISVFLSFRVFTQPKMIVTASFGIEPGRRVEYILLVEKALQMSSHRPSKVLVYNRPDMVRGEAAAAQTR